MHLSSGETGTPKKYQNNVNIGLGNGLLHAVNKPLPEPMQSDKKWLKCI